MTEWRTNGRTDGSGLASTAVCIESHADAAHCKKLWCYESFSKCLVPGYYYCIHCLHQIVNTSIFEKFTDRLNNIYTHSTGWAIGNSAAEKSGKCVLLSAGTSIHAVWHQFQFVGHHLSNLSQLSRSVGDDERRRDNARSCSSWPVTSHRWDVVPLWWRVLASRWMPSRRT